MRKPGSLREVAAWSQDQSEFHYRLADFLDQFRLQAEAAMLTHEPEPLAGRIQSGEVCDPYLAAVAVALAREIRSTPPRLGLVGKPQAHSSVVHQSRAGHPCDAAAGKSRAVPGTQFVRERKCAGACVMRCFAHGFLKEPASG